MINIVSYKVPKQGSVVVGSGYASSTTPSGGGSSTFDGNTIWGQFFDGSQPVTGDMTGVGSITASGDITTTADIIADGCVKSPCYSGGNATFSALTSATAALSALTATGITASGITGNTAHINNKLTTNQLEAISGFIGTLLSTNLTVENLTVTRGAHFFKLLIDEIKSVGGQIILTPANAELDKVESISGGWRCYWKSKDVEGKEISNQFEVNDQVVCQTFNAATGTSYNVSNTYYWRLVTATGRTTTTIDGTEYECNYIDLSSSDKDSASISDPAAGDSVAQLGNRTDTSRQAAIILSAYNSQFLDSGLVAPSIVQYAGINNYNLSTHRLNVISNGLNQFKGSYTDTNGNDLSTMITTTTGTVATLSGDVGTLSGTVTSHTQSISTLQQTDQAISGVVSSNTQSIGTLTNNVNTISGTVTSHTQSISNLVQTSSAISASVSSNTADITTISGNVNTVSGNVNTVSGNVNSLSATVSSHTQSIAALGLTDQAISGVVSSQTQSITTISGNVSTVSGNVNTLSGSVTSLETDVSDLEIQASGIQSTVTNIQQKMVDAWVLPLQGWQSYDYSQTSQSVEYNSDRTAVRDVDGDLCSPVVFVQSGQTATFEVWLSGNNNMWWYWCWGDQVELSAGAYYSQNRQQMGLTQQAETDSGGRHRYTATFTPSSDVYMTINYTNDGWLYNPRLVMSTGIATKSEVNQSANSLGMFLYDGLYETGIAIKNKTIKLRGDKVTFTNSAGNVSGKIWIDSTDGTLHAVNGDFSGIVNASMFYNNAKVVTGNYTIDLENDPHNMFIAIDTTVGITLPDPADYPLLELSFLACPTTQGSTATIGLASHDNQGRIVYLESGARYWYKSASISTYGKLFKIIAVGNYWYVAQGVVSTGTV